LGWIKRRLRVYQSVKNLQAIFAGFDQSRVAQDHKLLRNIRLAFAQRRFHVTHADLTAAAQHIQDLQPHRVRQRLKTGGEIVVGGHGFNLYIHKDEYSLLNERCQNKGESSPN
jgi:hypothetical protein